MLPAEQKSTPLGAQAGAHRFSICHFTNFRNFPSLVLNRQAKARGQGNQKAVAKRSALMRSHYAHIVCVITSNTGLCFIVCKCHLVFSQTVSQFEYLCLCASRNACDAVRACAIVGPALPCPDSVFVCRMKIINSPSNLNGAACSLARGVMF